MPLGSSNAKTREDNEPGWNRQGARTQEGNWVTLRGHREGLFSRRSWRQAEGEWAAVESSMTPVGTLLTRTLPQWTLRREETCTLASGNEVAIAVVRRWEVAESWSLDVSGLAKTTRFPLGIHLQADTRMLAKVRMEARASLQTPQGQGPRHRLAS